jgi:hypothetical protein
MQLKYHLHEYHGHAELHQMGSSALSNLFDFRFDGGSQFADEFNYHLRAKPMVCTKRCCLLKAYNELS